MFSRITSRLNQHAGVVILALAILGSGAYAYQLHSFSKQNHCQVELNKAVTANIKVRTQIAQRSDAAQTALIGGVGALMLVPATEDREEQLKRREDYLTLFRVFDQEVLAVQKARAENPVPEIVGVCD